MADIGLSYWFLPLLSCLITFIARRNNPSYLEQFHFKDITLESQYDFIIVGGGSAGSVLANRLSEIESWKVLLIEAGGEEDVISDVPLLATSQWNTDRDWNYTTVQQRHGCKNLNGNCHYSRGRGLGGSSSLTFMTYIRGNKFDYDNWEEHGNEGWGYDDVLPYFLKSEDMRIKPLAYTEYHSTGGYFTIEGLQDPSPLQQSYLQAGRELGFHLTDYNGRHQTGIGFPQFNTRNGTRCSAAKAFLSSVKGRPNLHIAKRTLALKVELNEENNKAVGVTVLKDGKKYFISARKEVILSAGSINTAKLLMLSGIGPKEHLEQVGISPNLDLPVGWNLVDHILLNMYFKINRPNITLTKSKVETMETVLKYAVNGSGILSESLGIQMVAHLTLDKKNCSLPVIQSLMTIDQAFVKPARLFETDEPIIRLTMFKLRPESVGTVKLRSSDPHDPPLIDPRYFDHPRDIRDSVKGCMLLLELMATDAMHQYKPIVYTPDNACKKKKGEAFCDCAVINYSNGMHHGVGTARMDEDGVVCPKLLVHGTSNLRVIDESIMPYITSANPNIPTLMIAEKGADLIKHHWRDINH